MDNKTARKYLKIAAVIYVASFLIINWNDVSWVFNYQEMGGLISQFFNPYPTTDAASMAVYFPNHSTDSAVKTVSDVQVAYTDKVNTLEIPKISLSVPIVFATATDKDSMAKYLDQGVVYYPGSVYPGQIGQIVILGHSAPPGWPTIKHDWVFTNLDKLNQGDTISIDINNKQYTYLVTKTTIIKRGADVPDSGFSGNNNVLTLVSCWPPGKDYQRIAVQATLEIGG